MAWIIDAMCLCGKFLEAQSRAHIFIIPNEPVSYLIPCDKHFLFQSALSVSVIFLQFSQEFKLYNSGNVYDVFFKQIYDVPYMK